MSRESENLNLPEAPSKTTGGFEPNRISLDGPKMQLASKARLPAPSGGFFLVVGADFLEVRIDDIVLCLGMWALRSRPRALGLIHRFAELHGRLHKVIRPGFDRFGVLAFKSRLQGANCGPDRTLVGIGDLGPHFRQGFLGGMNHRLAMILGIDEFTASLIFGSVRLSVLYHSIDIAFAEAARGLDPDLLLLVGCLVLRRYVDNAIGVDIESDVDLRHAAGRARDPDEIELAKQLIVRRHFAFALEDADSNRRLIVFRGRKYLALFGRNSRVPFDQPREHAAEGLDAEGQRRHVEQKHVLHVALEDAGLNRRADRDDFVGIDPFMQLLAEEAFDYVLHLGHPSHAADENDFIYLARAKPRVLQGLAARFDGFLDQIVDKRLEFRPCEFQGEMFRSRGVGGDIGQVDLGLGRGRQFDLGFFGRFLKALERELVLFQVDSIVLPELVGKILDKADIEILAAQEGVAVGRFHLEYAIADFEDGDVEGAAAEIVDRDDSRALFVEAIGERRSGRLVDDAEG